jgi:hypothetical protein
MGNRFSQNVERRCQVQVLHPLPRDIVGCGNGLATGKSAKNMYQDVQPAEFHEHFLDRLADLLLICEINRHGSKIRVWELVRFNVQ